MKTLTRERFITDLSRLVSLNTLTSDIESNTKALDFIQSKVDAGAIIKRIKNGKAQILIALNQDTKKPDFCYLVHADVVTGKPEQFKLDIKGGFAYGRGVSDMKFSIPIGYAILNNLISTKTPLSFALVVTTDEETGGYEGAQFLAKQYGFRPSFLIVPDGGDNFEFIDKAKGVCSLKISSKGIPAHASRPWDGKNAIDPLIKVCNEILKKYESNNRKETWKTTANIGIISGGLSANQVCAEASVVIDFRFPQTLTSNVIKREVLNIIGKIDKNLTITENSVGNPTYVDVSNPTVKRFIKCLEKELGRKIKIRGTYGASDVRHFADFGIPVLMIKPNGGDIHGDNENIDIDSCLTFYRGVLDFLTSWHR